MKRIASLGCVLAAALALNATMSRAEEERATESQVHGVVNSFRPYGMFAGLTPAGYIPDLGIPITARAVTPKPTETCSCQCPCQCLPCCCPYGQCPATSEVTAPEENPCEGCCQERAGTFSVLTSCCCQECGCEGQAPSACPGTSAVGGAVHACPEVTTNLKIYGVYVFTPDGQCNQSGACSGCPFQGAWMAVSTDNSDDVQLTQLIHIINETKSPATLVATAIAMMPMGKKAQPAVPMILRNAERLAMLDVDPQSVKGDLAATLMEAVFSIQAGWNADDAIERGLVFPDMRSVSSPMYPGPMPMMPPGAVPNGQSQYREYLPTAPQSQDDPSVD